MVDTFVKVTIFDATLKIIMTGLFLEKSGLVSGFFAMLWDYILQIIDILENFGVFLQWVWTDWRPYYV